MLTKKRQNFKACSFIKVCLLLVLLTLGMKVTAGGNQVDTDKLNSYRVETTVSGVYILAWEAYSKYAADKNISIDISDYLITFDETEKEFIIYFSKPRKERILGGGNGVVNVSKDSYEVTNVIFSK